MKIRSSNKIITPLVALEKMKSWCAYQERSQNETRQKLFEYKLEEEQVEFIIAELITENFINEERFANAFVSGKFRIKHWGKIKIKMALKQHRISDGVITKALKNIDGDEYEKILIKVIEKKSNQTKTTDKRKKFYEILNYAISKGFESDLVSEQLKLILGNQ
jgi:regulatory protein